MAISPTAAVPIEIIPPLVLVYPETPSNLLDLLLRTHTIVMLYILRTSHKYNISFPVALPRLP